MIVIILIGFILILYMILLGTITIGWYKIPVYHPSPCSFSYKVSIVIAVRNEAKTILNLLNDLVEQDYPFSHLEIVLIDDNSTDQTPQIIREFADRCMIAIRLLELNETGLNGKKAAIDFGISHSTGDLIITTDADCRIQSSWVKTIVSFYENKTPQLILSPVRFEPVTGLFGRLQEIEFMSLMASTAGSAQMRFPLMANGANLAYTRSAYVSCKGFTSNSIYPSGDDVFLMYNIKKLFGSQSIRFLKSKEAVVCTSPEIKIRDFFNQRLRWVSKSRGVKDFSILFCSILVYLTNLAFIMSLIYALFQPEARMFMVLFYLAKSVIDFPVMIGISRFYRRLNVLWLFPILEVINAFYVVIIGLVGNLMSFSWKGRTYKTSV